jgi:hypothetical protein
MEVKSMARKVKEQVAMVKAPRESRNCIVKIRDEIT